VVVSVSFYALLLLFSITMYDLSGQIPAADEPLELDIGYVGGGSRNWGQVLINDLALTEEFCGTVYLYDVDHESAEENAEFGEWVQSHDEAVADWEYVATDDLETALADVDFVVLSTQDPPGETFQHDLLVPEEYGIYQTVGDTVGPGGAFRAMRSVPQYREIAATVREQCPDAWVINYTNPMTVCTRTLYEEYPDINAVGLCHEVSTVQDEIGEMIERHTDHDAPDGTAIDVNVKGVNHFTFIDEARWRNRDLFDVLDAELDRLEPLPNHDPAEAPNEPPYIRHNHHIKFDLYRRFGMYGAAGDRHLAEFVPWYLDVEDRSGIWRWATLVTPGEHRTQAREEQDDERRAMIEGEEDYEFMDSGEEFVGMLKALTGIEPMRTNLNFPNRGQVDGLQAGAVVETNALVTADSVKPVASGGFPPSLRSILRTHVSNQEELVAAGFEGDLDRAFNAFSNDPLVTTDAETTRDLFTELVDLEREYLQDYNLDSADVMHW
jgi:alpha-galactosidase